MRPFPEAGDEQGNRDGDDDERAPNRPQQPTPLLSTWLPRRHFPSLLLLFSFLLLRVSLLFHPCIGFGLHLVLAAAALRRSRHMTPRRRDRELQQMRDEGSFGSALPNWS